MYTVKIYEQKNATTETILNILIINIRTDILFGHSHTLAYVI